MARLKQATAYLRDAARSESRATALAAFAYFTQDRLQDEATVAQLINQIVAYNYYDRDAIIQELERLRAEAMKDATRQELGSGLQTLAKMAVAETNHLIAQLKKIPGGYDVAIMIPSQSSEAEATRTANQLGQIGFKRVITDNLNSGNAFWANAIRNAGMTFDPKGLKRGVQFLGTQQGAGVIVSDGSTKILSMKLDSALTPILLQQGNQEKNPFVLDYAIALQAAVALLIAHEGKAALLKNPIALLEQRGLISSGFQNPFIQSNGSQIFISTTMVKAYLEWKAAEQARISA